MTNSTTAPKPLASLQEEQDQANRALDQLLAKLEEDGGWLTHNKFGSTVSPLEQRQLDVLEQRGYVTKDQAKHISVVAGAWMEVRYGPTTLGKLHLAEARLAGEI
jgi:hypothetical protein